MPQLVNLNMALENLSVDQKYRRIAASHHQRNIVMCLLVAPGIDSGADSMLWAVQTNKLQTLLQMLMVQLLGEQVPGSKLALFPHFYICYEL